MFFETGVNNSNAMLRNYLTIALRSIRRNLGYTAINVIGLSIGITASIVLFLLITFLTSFDLFYQDGDRIYRVVHSGLTNGREDFGAGVPVPFPEAMQKDLSGFESLLFISGRSGCQLTVETPDGRKNLEEGMYAYTDSTYFSFFGRKILSGVTNLSHPGEAVISASLAQNLFGTREALNQTLRLDNKHDLKVIGVIEDFPPNTTFPFNLLVSFEMIRKEKSEGGWTSVYSDDQVFVKLNAGADPSAANEQFIPFVKKYFDTEDTDSQTYWLQPLAELHHDTRFHNYRFRTVSYESLWAMGVVGFFLIVTASINFINLTTAVAARRSREVGVRKVMGGQRVQLVGQFLSEASLVTLLALVVSIGLAELAMIKINTFLDIEVHVNLMQARLWMFLVPLFVLVSLLSGMYPAWVVSGLKPVEALKNKLTNRGSEGFMLRRGLIVLQFMISNFLIVGTIVMISQLKYLRSKDLGFAKEAIITLPIPEVEANEKKESLKRALARVPGIQAVSLCNTPPSSGSVSATDFTLEGGKEHYITQVKMTDESYQRLFGLEMVAGTWLKESDTISSFVVNERLLKEVGMSPEEILGRNLTMWGRTCPVVGVVRDYHTLSLENEIDPVIMASGMRNYWTVAVKFEPGDWTDALRQVEKEWNVKYGEYIYSYQFLDQEIEEFYQSDRKMSTLFTVFTVLAILIGCVGLFGLVSFMTHEREKEVGVRKVLGASVHQIVFLFSREFVVLVTISFVLSAPVAAYLMNTVLSNFAYHITIGWSIFVIGLVSSLLIALTTVGYKSVRAALANPVESLRSE